MSDFDWEETKCRFKAVSRPGLYIMVFLIMVSTCDISYYHRDRHKEYQKLKLKVELIHQAVERIESRQLDERLKEGENVRRPN